MVLPVEVTNADVSQGKVSAPRSLVGEEILRNPSNQSLSHRNARSRARSWDDGGDFRSYTIRDNQVGFYVITLNSSLTISYAGQS